MEHILIIDETMVGERLDKLLSSNFENFSRSQIQTLCEKERVYINGVAVQKNAKFKVGDKVTVIEDEPQPAEILPENIPLDIIYEDKDLLVVNKPKGMVVHPAVGNYTGTLVNALLYHCDGSLSGINGVIRPGIVHRIDKNTSGLLIVAKNDMAHRGLAEQIKVHSFERKYSAIVHGTFKEDEFTIDAPIGRNPKDRKKMCVTPINSRNAVTHVKVLSSNKGFSYVECTLETGRTHQIRVHMAYKGHPVAGDDVYCNFKNDLKGTNGQCLHARHIGFVHPITKEYLSFTSELPEYFSELLKKLGLEVDEVNEDED